MSDDLFSALEKVLLERFLEKRLISGLKLIRETEDLQTLSIAAEPELQLAPVLIVGRNLLEAHVTGDFVERGINARCPAT